MNGILAVFGGGKERKGSPISITEVMPPSESERAVVAGLVHKIVESRKPFRPWGGVHNWANAFGKVADLPEDSRLTEEEKAWLEGKFRPDMDHCLEESRGIRAGDFRRVVIATYPERYLAARAGGFEVPLLLPEELKWGHMRRGVIIVHMLETLQAGFKNDPMEAPNRSLKRRMKEIISGNLAYLNTVFGLTFAGLDIFAREDGLNLRLGRKHPGVEFSVLVPLESITFHG